MLKKLWNIIMVLQSMFLYFTNTSSQQRLWILFPENLEACRELHLFPSSPNYILSTKLLDIIPDHSYVGGICLEIVDELSSNISSKDRALTVTIIMKILHYAKIRFSKCANYSGLSVQVVQYCNNFRIVIHI